MFSLKKLMGFKKWMPEVTREITGSSDLSGYNIWKSERGSAIEAVPVLTKLDTNDDVNQVADSKTKSIMSSRAWDVATNPVKAMFMNIFMLWMMGSGAGIFSILIISYALMQAVDILFNVNKAFSSFHAVDVTLQKLIYGLLSLGILYYLGGRAGAMGLLPIASGDWVSLIPKIDIVDS